MLPNTETFYQVQKERQVEKWPKLASAGVIQDGDPAKGCPDIPEDSWIGAVPSLGTG